MPASMIRDLCLVLMLEEEEERSEITTALLLYRASLSIRTRNYLTCAAL